MLDRKFVNAKIMDGTGAPWFRGEVAISEGRIVDVGRTVAGEAAETVDLGGRVLAPGFIDVHTHDDLAVLRDPTHAPKLLQGVTSVVLGNCGFGGSPSTPERHEDLVRYVTPVLGPMPSGVWHEFGQYLDTLSTSPSSVNAVSQVAHGAVRIAVMGFENRPATTAEIERMCALVSEAMQAGAIGLSFGLLYAPGCYADRRELVAVASAAARAGGILNCHIRTEGDTLLDSLTEVMDIAEAAGAPLHVSHLKVVGKRNWGTIGRALDLIADRRARGLDVTCDIYTYTAGSSTLLSVLPPWVSAGGSADVMARLADPAARERIRRDMEGNLPGWDNFAGMLGWDRVVISGVESEANRRLEGVNIETIAAERGQQPIDCMLDILLEENARVTMILHQMSEEDVKAVLRSDFAMVGSDGIPLETGKVHPRHYGTFPRMLAHYVRKERIMSVEEAVRKMTSVSARRFGLAQRGLIAEGAWADLVVFDAEKIQDIATFEDPRRYPAGLDGIYVNGRLAAQGGTPSAERAGKLIRHRCACCGPQDQLVCN
ncbi:MAG TPA: D-aminoacylase [Bosea sp. (in: a-proteobacteria)]|jgi:N-acyl-D-aspartate/D-glutamate deacylase|uniref:N-acyl-D-amino-acid deacylase family protein n=1 Tax=Bosea sp. (in: a-proteobacteria) TaxID=1871050 RepID=UPI002E139EDB|nr:D-aminoacylase [Bosea sp. (in: a-proteobacteria)]